MKAKRCEKSGKLGFKTKADALVKALRVSANPRVGANGGSVYRCPDCGRWHLTRRTRKPRKVRPNYAP